MIRNVGILSLGLMAFAGTGTLAIAQPADRHITIPAGSRVSVRLAQSLDTNRDKPGTPFVAHLSAPIVHNGEVVLPKGALCHGHLVESKPSGRLTGRAVMRLSLDTVQVNGATYTLATSQPGMVSKNHKKRNAALIGGGAGTGASIGAIAGGGVGALVGAGAGAAVGTTGAVITGKRNLHFAPETLFVFTLRQPLRVRV